MINESCFWLGTTRYFIGDMKKKSSYYKQVMGCKPIRISPDEYRARLNTLKSKEEIIKINTILGNIEIKKGVKDGR